MGATSVDVLESPKSQPVGVTPVLGINFRVDWLPMLFVSTSCHVKTESASKFCEKLRHGKSIAIAIVAAVEVISLIIAGMVYQVKLSKIDILSISFRLIFEQP